MNKRIITILIGLVMASVILLLIIFSSNTEVDKVPDINIEVSLKEGNTKIEGETEVANKNIELIDNETEEVEDIIELSSDPRAEVLNAFRQDHKNFANYINPIEEIISRYDNEDNEDLMQELFEIISNDLDTAEKITDALDQLENLSIEELRSSFDRAGFFMITSPYVYARLYSNLTPEFQAAVNRNWESEAIVEPVILKAVYEVEPNSEYKFKAVSPNNKYYKVIMEIVDKSSELYKKQGNYVLYMYSNKAAKHAEIEYVFCVDKNDQVNQSPLAGSFQLKDLLNH